MAFSENVNFNDLFFRSTPCPNVKSGDEWGDPVSCEAGDGCQYCHTRTEQQFHPEIYKSTKCNDIQNTSYCPRGAFCAFAHVERKNFLIYMLFFVKSGIFGTCCNFLANFATISS